MLETFVSSEALTQFVTTNVVTGRATFHVLFGPLTHYLTLISFDSPVDSNSARGTLSNVSLYSLTVTHTIPTQITPTSVKQTILVVGSWVNHGVASFEYLVVNQPTHSLCERSSQRCLLTGRLFAFFCICADLRGLPGICKRICGQFSQSTL